MLSSAHDLRQRSQGAAVSFNGIPSPDRAAQGPEATHRPSGRIKLCFLGRGGLSLSWLLIPGACGTGDTQPVLVPSTNAYWLQRRAGSDLNLEALRCEHIEDLGTSEVLVTGKRRQSQYRHEEKRQPHKAHPMSRVERTSVGVQRCRCTWARVFDA